MSAETGAPAIGVIDPVLAGGRRTRYLANMAELATRHRLRLAEVLELGPHDVLAKRLGGVLAARLAVAVVAPSLRHLRDAERWVTAHVDLYVVRPQRIYRRGHRWT